MLIKEITEGRYDPYTNKAIFFAGGAGAGKTFIARQLASIFHGLKQVNPDIALKHLLKKTNLSLKMPPEEEYFKNLLRQRSKQISGRLQQIYQREKLGMLIDTTGRSYMMIADTKKELEDAGYTTAMIFVDADLATQLKRNSTRQRQVPEKIIRNNYNVIKQNQDRYKRLFGDTFFYLNNSESTQDNIQDSLQNLEKNIKKFLQ
jgi:dephospho-CoA kinase